MDNLDIKKDILDIELGPIAQNGIKVGMHTCGISTDLPTAQEREGFILICHSGLAHFSYFHTEHSIHSRDIIIVFPGDIYTLDNPTADFTASWVRFNPQAMDEALHGFPTSFFSHISEHPVYSLTNNDEYSNRMDYLHLLDSKQSEERNICRHHIMLNLFRSLCLEILARIVRNFKIDTSEPKNRRRIVDEFVTLVSTNPRCREVAYFAQRLCITPKYLSAIVTEGIGFSAKEFIDRTAIAEIKQLLRTTHLSVKEIAERLNYAGSSNLCRFFKTRTGMTISQFMEHI